MCVGDAMDCGATADATDTATATATALAHMKYLGLTYEELYEKTMEEIAEMCVIVPEYEEKFDEFCNAKKTKADIYKAGVSAEKKLRVASVDADIKKLRLELDTIVQTFRNENDCAEAFPYHGTLSVVKVGVYEGEENEDGVPHGPGKVVRGDGSVLCEADWRNGVPYEQANKRQEKAVADRVEARRMIEDARAGAGGGGAGAGAGEYV